MASTLATQGATQKFASLELRYPMFGDWQIDGVLESGEAPARGAAVTVTVGDLVLPGEVIRSDLDAPDRPHVVVVGAPGWEQRIRAPLSYQSDAGVRLQTVLRDLSAASGQAIELPADAAIGEHYEVIAATAEDPATYRDALAELAEEGLLSPWRVDPDGVTRFGARSGVEVTARATVLRRDAGVGLAVYGIDSPKAFLPGNTISGVAINLLVVTETSGHLEAEIYTPQPNAAPSLRASIQRMIWRRTQEIMRTYIVQDVDEDARLTLVPPPDATHLPEMRRVPMWTLGGARVQPKQGSEVLVVFRDRQRRRPVAIACSPADIEGIGIPDQVDIDGDQIVLAQGTLPCGRGGLQLQVLPAAAPGATLQFVFTDPDGNPHRWNITGAAGATPVTFAVVPSTGVDPLSVGVLDAGRPEVLV